MRAANEKWLIFQGKGEPVEPPPELPAPPPWRTFSGVPVDRALPAGRPKVRFEFEPHEVELVNAALYLRRPLLITGKPGIGKSSLAHSVAYELGLGPVLVWPINTRTTLQDGLCRYDAVGRLHDQSTDVGNYVRMGPLGT